MGFRVQGIESLNPKAQKDALMLVLKDLFMRGRVSGQHGVL